MENPLNASFINDFIFCPYSIFVHNMYEDVPKDIYQEEQQLLGTFNHEKDIEDK